MYIYIYEKKKFFNNFLIILIYYLMHGNNYMYTNIIMIHFLRN
jgi:hypothetical protein